MGCGYRGNGNNRVLQQTSENGFTGYHAFGRNVGDGAKAPGGFNHLIVLVHRSKEDGAGVRVFVAILMILYP